jgi:hypothetical protein
MTKDEFKVGWDLLTAQPWGKRYATVNDKASAATAATQLQFYFRKLGQFPFMLWYTECELYAAGDHWPSVDEIKQASNNALPKLQRIEQHRERTEIPEPIAKSLAHSEAHGVTFLEGMRAVLPGWCQENPNHPDHARAEKLYQQFKNAKPSGQFNATVGFRP